MKETLCHNQCLPRRQRLPEGNVYPKATFATEAMFATEATFARAVSRIWFGDYLKVNTKLKTLDILEMQDNDPDNEGIEEEDFSAITATKPKPKKPNLYRVLLLNDDYTPMDFVIHVLEIFFQKDRKSATQIMLHVHNHGAGECGVFTYEVAESKVVQVMNLAQENQHPLQCVMEKK